MPVNSPRRLLSLYNTRKHQKRWATNSGRITQWDVWRKGISYSIFLRQSVVNRVGNFEESLGAGAGTPWGSGEETDYLLRALDAGFRIYFDPAVHVHHPRPKKEYDAKRLSRAYHYGKGMGRVLRKHRYPIWFILYQWARPLGGMLVSLGVGRLRKARFHWAVLRGRIIGWCPDV